MRLKNDKNLHLHHIEDLVLEGGVSGTRGAIDFLISLRNMLAGHSAASVINLSTKWDGAPAIIAGINPENNKFFVGTKSVFNKAQKINYTNTDIDNNHPNSGLNNKLKVALKYLPELGIKDIIQGDIMFTKDDLSFDKLDGEEYVTFQPNTLVYAVPASNALAKQIISAKLGVVWHTTYTGTSMDNLRAIYGVNISALKFTKNVWFRDADFTDISGTVTLTQEETDRLTSILSKAGSLFNSISSRILGEISSNGVYKELIHTWNNKMVRSGQEISDTAGHVSGLIKHVEQRYTEKIATIKIPASVSNKKAEKDMVVRWFRQNSSQLKLIFDLQKLIVNAKTQILSKLTKAKSLPHTFIRDAAGLRVTAPEGFVAVDRLKNNAIKLVDRLTFSHANFNIPKNWD